MGSVKLFINDETVDKILDNLVGTLIDDMSNYEILDNNKDLFRSRQVKFHMSDEETVYVVQLVVNNSNRSQLNIMLIKHTGDNPPVFMEDKDFYTLQSKLNTSAAHDYARKLVRDIKYEH